MQSYSFNMLSGPSKASLLVFISSLVALVPPNVQVGYLSAILPSGTFYGFQSQVILETPVCQASQALKEMKASRACLALLVLLDYQLYQVQHLRRELYRAQSQGCLASEENEVQKETQASKESKSFRDYRFSKGRKRPFRILGKLRVTYVDPKSHFLDHKHGRVYLGLEVWQAPEERKGKRLSVRDQACQEIRVILVPRGSLVRQEPQARTEYQVYQACQAFRVTVDRASQVKRGYQDFLVKKATLVQLAPQELGYQDLLDLVGFLEIKE
ncbi:hypothetical protein J1605_010558 [Eschrichtius robustus]|uniref:Uncharacterized protein n=1 Tax=Eschrichtius robustus TaxID=9764 RepID=A0AB34GTS6_ESCRO|nr:hypothetical protein J1605_010558 [Eschrichtius robustus]